MTQNKGLTVGNRVQVSPTAPRYQGRTGIILELRSAPEESGSRTWLVRFDWPLGGMGSYDVVSEDNLEPLQNIPLIENTPRKS